MKTLSILAAALALSTFACASTPMRAASAESIDGRRFAVEAELPDGRILETDLTFGAGVLDVSASRGTYTIVPDGDALTFSAEMRGTSGVEAWRGRIVGKSVAGTITSPDGKVVLFHGQAS